MTQFWAHFLQKAIFVKQELEDVSMQHLCTVARDASIKIKFITSNVPDNITQHHSLLPSL